jgi:hypothetical protein
MIAPGTERVGKIGAQGAIIVIWNALPVADVTSNYFLLF